MGIFELYCYHAQLFGCFLANEPCRMEEGGGRWDAKQREKELSKVEKITVVLQRSQVSYQWRLSSVLMHLLCASIQSHTYLRRQHVTYLLNIGFTLSTRYFFFKKMIFKSCPHPSLLFPFRLYCHGKGKKNIVDLKDIWQKLYILHTPPSYLYVVIHVCFEEKVE